MVSLPQVLAANVQIPSSLPKHLVVIFAGATSGISEATLNTLAKYATEPRIYILARSQSSAERIIASCRQINPSGSYIFMRVDLRSVKQTNLACEYVRKREEHVNLIKLSAGQIAFGRT
jgi:NADP-dependent 3-hydroxy acid dehydrogenase YdfG